jgi:hypothetical protein
MVRGMRRFLKSGMDGDGLYFGPFSAVFKFNVRIAQVPLSEYAARSPGVTKRGSVQERGKGGSSGGIFGGRKHVASRTTRMLFTR